MFHVFLFLFFLSFSLLFFFVFFLIFNFCLFSWEITKNNHISKNYLESNCCPVSPNFPMKCTPRKSPGWVFLWHSGGGALRTSIFSWGRVRTGTSPFSTVLLVSLGWGSSPYIGMAIAMHNVVQMNPILWNTIFFLFIFNSCQCAVCAHGFCFYTLHCHAYWPQDATIINLIGSISASSRTLMSVLPGHFVFLQNMCQKQLILRFCNSVDLIVVACTSKISLKHTQKQLN